MSQTNLELLALRKFDVQRLREILKATAAALLRFIHRDIGSFDQVRGGFAGIRVHRNADAWRRINFAVADFIFLGQHQQQFLCGGCGIAGFAEVLEADDKLVATPTAGEVADA